MSYSGLYEEEALLNPSGKLRKKLRAGKARRKARREARRAQRGHKPGGRLLRRGLLLPPPPMAIRKRRRARQAARQALPNCGVAAPNCGVYNGLLPVNVGVDYYGVAVQNASALINGYGYGDGYGGALTSASKRAQAARTRWLKKRAKKIKKIRAEAKKRQDFRKAGRAERREIRRDIWRG